MTIKEYESGLINPLRVATLMLLIRDDEVLLAMKKRGFGEGKWNGTGGKVKPGETIVQAARRETNEEIGVEVEDMNQVGLMRYHFPDKPDSGMEVYIFTATKWNGPIAESEEMRPQWFKQSEVPFKNMWADDPTWMPLVFAGALVRGSFLFKGDEMGDHVVEIVESFE